MKNNIVPDTIFEVSWEVCNKIGGIHAVLATKAYSLVKKHHDILHIVVSFSLTHK